MIQSNRLSQKQIKIREILLYGLRNNELVHISQVESGKKCNCKCPACGEYLIARNNGRITNNNGVLRLKTFAHYDPKKRCFLYLETTLHYLAKNIISENSKILLPEIKATIGVSDSTHLEEITVVPSKYYDYNEVLLEQRLNSIKPDVSIKIANTKLLIEIKVTHGIDQLKLEKIKALNLSVIEIDLSKHDRKLIDLIFLKQCILDSVERSKWVNNSKQTLLNIKYQAIEKEYLIRYYKNVTTRKFQKMEDWGYQTLLCNHIDNCKL